MSELTLPISTIWATSSVSASVTRRPSTNSVSLPMRRSHSPICGPPPCTTTGRMPTRCIITMSFAKSANSSGRDMALPPNFTTTTAPRNCSMYGSACSSTSTATDGSCCASSGRCWGWLMGRSRRSRARRSRPGRARGWRTAPRRPTAPLPRLSIAPMPMTVPVRSSTRAVRCAALEPSVALVDGERSLTTTNGSSAVEVRQAVQHVGGAQPVRRRAARSRWPGCPGSSAPGAA